VIDAEFGREDHGSIPAIAIGRRLKLLDVRTDPEPNSTVGGKKKTCIQTHDLIKFNVIENTT
jgi:hypothetical protein